MDKFTQYAMVAAQEAIEGSNLNLEQVDKNRIGVIWGAGIGGIETFQNEVLELLLQVMDTPRFNPFFIPKMIADIAPGQISMKYGFTWPKLSQLFQHVPQLQIRYD